MRPGIFQNRSVIIVTISTDLHLRLSVKIKCFPHHMRDRLSLSRYTQRRVDKHLSRMKKTLMKTKELIGIDFQFESAVCA